MTEPGAPTRVIYCYHPAHHHVTHAARIREFDGVDDLTQARICKLIDAANHPLSRAASAVKSGPWPIPD